MLPLYVPCYNYYKVSLENLKKKFLKFLHFKTAGACPVRCTNQLFLLYLFKIRPLNARRIFQQLSFLFKLLHNIIDCSFLLSKIYFYTPRLNCRHFKTFHCMKVRTNIGLNSPIRVMCCCFNAIDIECDINHCNLSELLSIAKVKFADTV